MFDGREKGLTRRREDAKERKKEGKEVVSRADAEGWG
jgi:hypothetical protein